MLYRDPGGQRTGRWPKCIMLGLLPQDDSQPCAGEHVVDFQPRVSPATCRAVLMAKVLVFLEKTRCAALEKKACRTTIFGCKPVEVEICECASPMHYINGIAQIIDVYFCL